MKAVQYFSDEYLEQCSKMKPDEIVRFLEDFRLLHGAPKESAKLISLKVPPPLLRAFKAKSELEGTPYQSKIKVLMTQWIKE